MSETVQDLRTTIDTIEKAYEYMLAYAAQGRDFEDADGSGPSIRLSLQELLSALGVIGDVVASCAAGQSDEAVGAFHSVLNVDADKAQKAVALVLVVPSISSQLIDNLNASIHLRALLTDLFLFDEVYKAL